MLKAHSHLLEPPSERLRIGECVVDLSLREILAPGQDKPQRVTVKSINVLMTLISHGGKVVSREALLDWVWPDTTPSDDVVTQAITQLRRALGDDRVQPHYIETIAKQGYRLLEPVEWLETAPAPASAGPSPATPAIDAVAEPARMPPRRSWSKWALAGSLAAIAIVVLAASRLLPETQAPVPAAAPATARAGIEAAPVQVVRLTSVPGMESWPNISPDGNLVVYTRYDEESGSAWLMLQTSSPVVGHALTPPVKARYDTMPVWSPDGREIAFFRSVGEQVCRLMLIPASGGEPREIAPCPGDSMGKFGWHPDGTRLVIGGTRGAGDVSGPLQTLDIATGRYQALRYDRRDSDVDIGPTYSPDGKWIAFHRNLSVADLWRIPAAGGVPQRLTQLKTNLYGLAWTPDSRSIVFGRYGNGQVGLSRLDLATGTVGPLGIDDAMYPSIALRSRSMVFTMEQGTSGVYRIRNASPSSGSPPGPERVFGSTGEDLLPSPAPDGHQIMLVSDRSEEMRLWWADLRRPDSLRMIDGFIPVLRYPVEWSPDSQRVLSLGEDGNALYEVTVASGRLLSLPKPPGVLVHATYHPDPSRLLIGLDSGSGRLELGLYDRSTRPLRALATLPDVARFWVDGSNERIVFIRQSKPGLFAVGLDLRGVTVLHPSLPARQLGGRRVVVEPRAIWLLDHDKTCPMRRTPLAPAGEPGPCLGRASGSVVGLSRNPVDGDLFLTIGDEGEADVGWASVPASSGRGASPPQTAKR